MKKLGHMGGAVRACMCACVHMHTRMPGEKI